MSNTLINNISTNNNLSNSKIQNENNKHITFQSQSTSSNNSIEEDNINDEIINKNESLIIQTNNQIEKNDHSKKWEISEGCDLDNFQLKIENRVEEILIDIFENTVKNYNNKYSLTIKSTRFAKDIKYYCEELRFNFAIFILTILSQKFIPLINYVQENYINTSNFKIKKLFKIKNCLAQTGNDIQKVFKSVFNITYFFDIGSVLVEIFLRNILSENDISNYIKNEDFEKLETINSIGEKDRFESYLNQFKSYLYLYDNEYNTEENNEEEKEEDEEKIDEIKKEEEKINDNMFNIIEKDIDELVEYINSDIPLKKGKKKKKKNKKNKNNYKIEDNINENNNLNIIDIRDDIVENFKNSINQYTVENHKKIRPNLSKNWLNKINKFQI